MNDIRLILASGWLTIKAIHNWLMKRREKTVSSCWLSRNLWLVVVASKMLEPKTDPIGLPRWGLHSPSPPNMELYIPSWSWGVPDKNTETAQSSGDGTLAIFPGGPIRHFYQAHRQWRDTAPLFLLPSLQIAIRRWQLHWMIAGKQ